MGLCCRQFSIKGTRSGRCEKRLGRYSIREGCFQLPPLLLSHHFWSDIDFLVIGSISLPGLHTVTKSNKQITLLNTALGRFSTYCFMGAFYIQTLFLQTYCFNCFPSSSRGAANMMTKRCQQTGFLSHIVGALDRTQLSTDYIHYWKNGCVLD